MATCVALLRGINVGRANRIPMADLKKLVTDLGYSDVKTLLNSGNVVFDSGRRKPETAATAIEKAIQSDFELSVPVVVVTATEMATVVARNPLHALIEDPSRLLVAFGSKTGDFAPLKGFVREDWGPDAIALGKRWAYLWCAAGVLNSKLYKEFSRITGKTVTMRNWATVLKLHAMTGA